MLNQSWLRGRTVVYNPAQKPPAQKKFCFIGFLKKILGFFWRVFKRLSLIIGAIFLISFFVGIWSGLQSHKSVAPIMPNNMVLSFNLDGALPERDATSDILSRLKLEDAPVTIDDIVNSLDAATKDNRVKALVVNAQSGGYDLTQLQSLRAAVLRFKASGKKTAIYSESYGDSGYGLGLYYLASAFDQIWMQPVGIIAIGGVNIQSPFFKDVMDDYGVQGQFFQRKEYKNAMEHLTSNKMSLASKEEMQALATDMATQLIDPIKQSRKKLAPQFDALVNLGMLTDVRALKEGLIDRLDYQDVLLAEIQKANAGASLIEISDYTKTRTHLLPSSESFPVIAVIPVEGMIVSGSAGSSPYGFKQNLAGADDIVSAIEDAANDKSVKTIVLRINSPGGSPSASETVHRAIIWAKTIKKKSIIVSMGALAASGGYWIAAPADKIYAMDATLTGSIGVVGGKINLKGLWDKYHVRWDGVQYGDNSGMMSMNTPFSASEQVQFEATLDNVYDYFIKRVADGRHMTPEQVEKIAKGRAYTGRQALKIGLVDKIGGLDVVLDDIAKAHKVASRDNLNLVYLPQTDDPMQLLMQLVSRKIGLSPFIDKMSAILSPMLMMGESKGARLVVSEPRIIR